MATLSDLETLKKEMKKVKKNPKIVGWLGCVQIGYSEVNNRWNMTFDGDLVIWFDDVEFVSNSIILKRDGIPFAGFCHMHQRIDYDLRE